MTPRKDQIINWRISSNLFLYFKSDLEYLYHFSIYLVDTLIHHIYIYIYIYINIKREHQPNLSKEIELSCMLY
jgi:hypothetical protein